MSYAHRIREKPPLRLSVSVKTPGGLHARWGEDDKHPANSPKDLTFSTAMPGGFDTMSCTLERDPRVSYPDLEELSMLTVAGPGGQVAWQGRLQKLPATGGFSRDVTPEAVGYQAALEDDSSAREIYVDAELSKWEDVPVRRKIALIEGGWVLNSPSVAASEGQGAEAATPAVVTELQGPWSAHSVSAAHYDGHGVPIAALWWGWQSGATVGESAEWHWYAVLTNNEAATEQDVTEGTTVGHAAGSTLTGERTATTSNRTWAYVQALYNLANAEAKTYPFFWKQLAVYGRHGLTLQGTNSLSEHKGVLASDVVAHAIGKWAPEIAFTTGSNGSIQPTSFIIPQLVFIEPTNVAEILKQAIRFDLPDWAVWEGPKFWMNGRGERGKKWRARVGPAQLQEAGPQASRLWNGVVVSYTDVTGKPRLVGPPGMAASEPGGESSLLVDHDPENPANELGIHKWAPLKMGTSTQQGAIQVGARFLQEQKTLERSGQAALSGHVEDLNGNWWPAWMVRAGDEISFVDAHDVSYRRIVSTSNAAGVNTLQLEQPPDSLQAVLERLSVVLLPFGLS